MWSDSKYNHQWRIATKNELCVFKLPTLPWPSKVGEKTHKDKVFKMVYILCPTIQKLSNKNSGET